jgi:hypothetical protein
MRLSASLVLASLTAILASPAAGPAHLQKRYTCETPGYPGADQVCVKECAGGSIYLNCAGSWVSIRGSSFPATVIPILSMFAEIVISVMEIINVIAHVLIREHISSTLSWRLKDQIRQLST